MNLISDSLRVGSQGCAARRCSLPSFIPPRLWLTRAVASPVTPSLLSHQCPALWPRLFPSPHFSPDFFSPSLHSSSLLHLLLLPLLPPRTWRSKLGFVVGALGTANGCPSTRGVLAVFANDAREKLLRSCTWRLKRKVP